MTHPSRWGIAAAGILAQMALGAVYAWSVFRIPLAKQFHWTISQVTLTFTICVFVMGISAFFGGLWLNKRGPRVVALTGGFLYGLGVFLASFSADKLWWLYLSYGLIGGIGLGFGYIVPVAVLIKWFPDRRGLITGIAVGGFGAGALLTAPAASYLIQKVGVLQTFAWLGVAYLIVTMFAGYFMQNPPDGWKPAGWSPSATQTKQRAASDYKLGEALKTWQWWALWLLLFLNVSAGISLISQESPMFQEIAKVSAAVAAGMVGIASIGNAVGRIFWAWTSDAITRRWTFVTMLLLQVGLIWAFPSMSSAPILTARRVRYPDVLRRRIRHHARLHGRLLRIEECRSHLRTDADRVGLRKRIWTAHDRATAPIKRIVCKRTACYLSHPRRIGTFAHTGVASQIASQLNEGAPRLVSDLVSKH